MIFHLGTGDMPQSNEVLANDGAQGTEDDLASVLPASMRTTEDDLMAPALFPVLDPAAVNVDPVQLASIHDWVDEETDLRRLSDIHGWLWIVGRPMPPRPLHHQRVLNREIVIAERMDLHLVWTTNRIFVKPLSRFLLEPRFWVRFLHCDNASSIETNQCACGGRRERALGFLFSYAALVAHESDFQIAKELRLLPEGVQWPAWRATVRELLRTSPIYPRIDRRFYYGELRLSRLNKIYYYWKTPLRGYLSRWNQYGSFFYDNFALLAGSTVYIAVVLSAMQVGLATNVLQQNETFQAVSYGFTVFSILGPLAAAGLFMVVFCYLFVGNWAATRQYSRQRLQRIERR
ncbi:hypothetical protein CPLU01_11450 [Colletotrichum plurivorum]|uniref:Subtilisin-like serine protease n=1 Tax=Colletotrichum plurivorum TaxID=2175906 RepID=A0A8H6N7S7_9PEZI|nr:hypothetical protein CPLU01_11450 [Colletotrichum plurivorum]